MCNGVFQKVYSKQISFKQIVSLVLLINVDQILGFYVMKKDKQAKAGCD